MVLFYIVTEWTYDYSNDKFPFYHHLKENYPSSKQIDDFITIYLRKGSSGIMPNEQEKKQLLEEISLFTLASHLFWGIWGVVNVNQEIEFGYWDYANLRIEEYFKAKENYQKQRLHILSNREAK
jgi:choline/ethanolamine kinase